MNKIVVFNALQTSLSGGIGRYCFELVKEMYSLKSEIDLKVVIREEDLNDFRFIEMENLIIAKNIKSGKHRNIYEQFILPKIVRKKFPSAILHYPDTMAPLFAKNKVIITVHDMAFISLKNEFSFKTKIWKNIITKASMKKAQAVIAITNFTKSEIIKYYPKYENKISVIYNGFNDFSNEKYTLENIRQIIKEINYKYILSVNTITPRKNIQGIIEAFNIIKDKTDAKLIIAGKEGYKSQEILGLIDKYNLADRVIVTGKINDDELICLYKYTSLYMYMSFYEGFGLSPLEAMSFNIPTIVSNTTSIPEVVGNEAIKIDPNNIEKISTEMIKILNDNQYNLNLKNKLCKKRIKFSWNLCGQDVLGLYNKLNLK